MNFKRLIRLDFVPASADAGLFLLRAWLGLSMLLIHGIGKVQNFGGTLANFREKLGIPEVLGAAAILSESVGAALIVIGLATRWAALAGAVGMAVAFIQVHKMILQQGNPASGEMAFLYLGGFLALLIAGPGRWSVDAKLGR